ncbi:MAG TPA: type VI secretion system tube protein Hcp [Candidatus Omnitrophota bacterium]|nr:type VI secretion system tube protein Hcp [Candidatus Omnitrophota bacterium]
MTMFSFRAMAEMYLQVDGIAGDTGGTDKAHQGAMLVSGIKGATVKAGSVDPITFVKPFDHSSAGLISYCLNGTKIEHVTFDYSAGSNLIHRIFLTNAAITSYVPVYDKNSGFQQAEEITFSFDKIKFDNGQSGKNGQVEWDNVNKKTQ